MVEFTAGVATGQGDSFDAGRSSDPVGLISQSEAGATPAPATSFPARGVPDLDSTPPGGHFGPRAEGYTIFSNTDRRERSASDRIT